jgi:hypothetical protein
MGTSVLVLVISCFLAKGNPGLQYENDDTAFTRCAWDRFNGQLLGQVPSNWYSTNLQVSLPAVVRLDKDPKSVVLIFPGDES